MSAQDIDKGSRWIAEIQQYLSHAKGCIVCLTPENVSSPWIYWETGAIALAQSNPICPLLVGVTPEDIREGPLTQFQCTFARKDDVLLLVDSLNRRLDRPEDNLKVQALFERNWEELRTAFIQAAAMSLPNNVRELLEGLQRIHDRFRRQWESGKAADKWDPIKTLVAESASDLVDLVQNCKVDQRIQHHCTELKGKIEYITHSSRELAHKTGDQIGGAFDKAIAAIRADYPMPEIT